MLSYIITFPEPTSPIIAISSPCRIVKFIFSNFGTFPMKDTFVNNNNNN